MEFFLNLISVSDQNLIIHKIYGIYIHVYPNCTLISVNMYITAIVYYGWWDGENVNRLSGSLLEAGKEYYFV